MPSDLSGVSIYERGKEAFVFHPGPIFAQVLLADEINRASPKTQSALLEAMEEKQVSVEGETRALPTPFFVIATQNPHDQLGTYALPESQLDRFLMRISLGYPDRASERELLAGSDRRAMIDALRPLLTQPEMLALQQQVLAVHAADPLLNYVQDLIAASRNGKWFVQGLSPVRYKKSDISKIKCVSLSDPHANARHVVHTGGPVASQSATAPRGRGFRPMRHFCCLVALRRLFWEEPLLRFEPPPAELSPRFACTPATATPGATTASTNVAAGAGGGADAGPGKATRMILP